MIFRGALRGILHCETKESIPCSLQKCYIGTGTVAFFRSSGLAGRIDVELQEDPLLQSSGLIWLI